MKRFCLFYITAFVTLAAGCRPLNFMEGGRVESKYRNYYFNDNHHVGAVLYGDMDLAFRTSATRNSIPKLTQQSKMVLKLFHIGKLDTILFCSNSKGYSIIGLVRNAIGINQSEFENVLDRKVFYMLKTIKIGARSAFEGIIRLDNHRYLSIIDYGESNNPNSYAGFHTIMINSAQRIKDGEMMLPVLNPFEDADDLFEEDGYLAAYKFAAKALTYKDKSLTAQALATYYSFAGDLASAKILEDSFINSSQKELEYSKMLPASNQILSLTKHEQVIMFNTAHHRPEHAYFVSLLLDNLFKQGFTYLALESLRDSNTVMQKGFANSEDGFYTRDPVMSNLISKAISIGYHVIGYDYEGPTENRELDGAKYLVDQTIALDKTSKVVVLAGFAHISEKMIPKKLAGFFQDMTGIDPLTIDQTSLMGSLCIDFPQKDTDEVFVYKSVKNDFGADILLWNKMDMTNKPINPRLFADPLKDVSVETPDLKSYNQERIAFLVYDKTNFIKDPEVTPIFVDIFPGNKYSHRLKLIPGSYLIKCLGDKKTVLFETNLVVN